MKTLQLLAALRSRASRTGILVVLIAGVATGCKDGPTRPTPIDDPEPAAIVLNPTSVQCASLNEVFTVEAAVVDREGRPMDGVPLVWTVPADGIVEELGGARFACMANGSTTLEVGISGAYVSANGGAGGTVPVAELPVTVEQVAVALELGTELFTAPGDGMLHLWSLGQSLSLTVWSVDALGNAVAAVEGLLAWGSGDDNVSTVSDGLITAASHGRTSISVESGELTGAIEVDVNALATLQACIANPSGGTSQACVQLAVTFAEEGH